MGTYIDMRCPDCQFDEYIGHVIPNVSAGTLFWSCMECGFAWPRDLRDPELFAKARVYAAMWNAKNGRCYICGDAKDHNGRPHSLVTGDGRLRSDIGKIREVEAR